MKRALLLFFVVIPLASTAYADSVTVNFTEQGFTTSGGNVFSEVPSVGTLQLSLNSDDTISVILAAFEPVSGFAFNGLSGQVSTSNFSTPGPFDSSWVNWFGDYDSGFLVCIAPAACNSTDPVGSFETLYTFTIGTPGEFTSVMDIANYSGVMPGSIPGNALAQFWLLTSDGTQEEQFGGNVVHTPEPSTLLLLGLGLAFLLAFRIQCQPCMVNQTCFNRRVSQKTQIL